MITPLFLVAGTFFPIDQLPEGFQIAAQFNPLHQLVELVRHASFGFESTDPLRFAGLLVFALAALARGGAAHGEAADRLAAARLRVAQLPTAGPMTWARGCANLSHGCSSLLTPVPAPAATS